MCHYSVCEFTSNTFCHQIRRPKGDMSDTSVTELVLLNLSTGKPHTSATQPLIFLTETTPAHGHCSVMLEIVGDNLALLLTYRQHLGLTADTFCVYDWRDGTVKAVRLSLVQLLFEICNHADNVCLDSDATHNASRIPRLHFPHRNCSVTPKFSRKAPGDIHTLKHWSYTPVFSRPSSAFTSAYHLDVDVQG